MPQLLPFKERSGIPISHSKFSSPYDRDHQKGKEARRLPIDLLTEVRLSRLLVRSDTEEITTFPEGNYFDPEVDRIFAVGHVE